MRIHLALGLLVMALAQTAVAQNRVPNGSFDQDTSPWFGAPASSAYTTLAWDFADANGLTSSGSARITNSPPSPGNGSYVYSPCIAVTPGENLLLRGRMLRPSGQGGGANGGNGWIFLYWFNQSTCATSNPAFGTGPSPTVATEDQWITYELNPLAVPPEARGVRVGLIVSRYASASTYTILFDDIVLLGLGAAPSLAIDGPSTVEAGSPATFTATAAGCDADEGRWSWNVGNGVIEGDDQGSSVRVTWSSAGQQSVSATHAACAGAVASSNVTVTPAGAQVVVSSIPEGLMQLTGVGGEATSYMLTNSGSASTVVTVVSTGNFFDHVRTALTIAPGSSEEVRVVARAMPAGSYVGESRISGAGVPPELNVPIRLMVAHPPDGTVEASVPDPVREVRGSGAVATGTFTLHNDGAAQLHGVITTDASWLTVSPSTVSISPGGSTQIQFTSDRAKQEAAGFAGGSATATAIVRYLVPGGSSGSSGSAERLESTSTGPTTGKTTVTVVDTRSLAVAVSALPALQFGELAWMLPLTDAARFDVAFAGRPASGPIDGLKLFLQPTSSAANARSVTLPTFGASAITYANFLSSIFQTDVDAGALHMRSGTNDSFVPIGTMHVETAPGSARRAVPVFRSDRATGSETRLALPGLGRSAELVTDIHVQEMTGSAVQATVELRNEAGAVISSVVRDVSAFGALVVPNAVPAGAVSASIRLSGSGRIVAYGVRHDASGEQALVVDWGRVYGVAPGELLVMPLVDRGDDHQLMLSIANASPTESTTVTGELVPGGRRRGVRRSSGPSASTKTWTIGPNASRTVADLEAAFGTARNGYVRFSSEGGSPAIVVQKVRDSGNDPVATEALPMTPASYANSSRGTVFVFDDVPEDVASGSGSVADLRLIEVKGAPARVRVRVTHPPKSGGGATAVAVLARDFELQAYQSMDIPDILEAVIGNTRERLGALRNVTLTISSLSGDGRVLGFLVERDTESQEWTIRAPM